MWERPSLKGTGQMCRLETRLPLRACVLGIRERQHVFVPSSAQNGADGSSTKHVSCLLTAVQVSPLQLAPRHCWIFQETLMDDLRECLLAYDPCLGHAVLILHSL